MARSARVPARAWRDLHRLVGECRDLGDDPAAWRRHNFAGLARLVGADLAAGGELTGVRSGVMRSLGDATWGWENGFNPAGWQRALELLAVDPGYSQVMVAYCQRVCREPGVAATAYDLIGERAFFRGVEYQEVYRTIGVHHTLWCSQFIPGAPDETEGGLLSRAAGRPDFTAREKAIVTEAFALLAPLLGGPLARFADPSPADLPPRARAVLRCFLEGDSDKQVGLRLGLTRHTVNWYAKLIHRHFGVASRPELLARWVRRGWPIGGW